MASEQDDIHRRLAGLRHRLGLSLRSFAEVLRERAGYDVSHDSVRRYEDGRTIPTGYVKAVCEAFDVAVEHLLFNEEGELPADQTLPNGVEDGGDQTVVEAASPEHVLRQWRRFLNGLRTDDPLREIILQSWERSSDAGVAPESQGVELRVVPERERIERTEAARDFLSVARAHLECLSVFLSDVPHVAYVTCRDGIILVSLSNEPELAEEWGLYPGVDWSEETMGTNGAGTALKTGRPVVVVGPEHFRKPLHDSTCAAAPIRGADGLAGAIDLSTTLAHGKPQRLALVSYVARMIERDLRRH